MVFLLYNHRTSSCLILALHQPEEIAESNLQILQLPLGICRLGLYRNYGLTEKAVTQKPTVVEFDEIPSGRTGSTCGRTSGSNCLT